MTKEPENTKASSKKVDLIKKYQSHENDTGSIEVQVAVLSSQIDALRLKLRGLGLADSMMPQLAHGEDGIVAVATYPDAETVVTGIVGCAGLMRL